jgi:hypothetical protein
MSYLYIVYRMIYFIVTTSLFNNCMIRRDQYIAGISKLKERIDKLSIEDYKIIIVENNGERPTFLNSLAQILDCQLYYTNNNSIITNNKGVKELRDIFDCITKYSINDNDFIVKITGRYILEDESEFMNNVKNLPTTNYKCIIKYGSFMKPLNYKVDDCITGLIGMVCSHVKQIKMPGEYPVEWNWAKEANLIEPEKVCLVDKLGINICVLESIRGGFSGPTKTNYFKV